MVIVDTTVWIDYLAGARSAHTDWILRESGQQEIGLIDLILCEVLQGVRGDSLFLRTQQELANFDLFVSAGEGLAVASARNYRFLRARGITIRNTIDCIIATFCLSEGHSLLHNDRGYDPFESLLDLQVIHPQNI